jgi:hypothetical protein
VSRGVVGRLLALAAALAVALAVRASAADSPLSGITGFS